MKKIDFASINQAALNNFEGLLREWLPGGKKEGGEYKSLNPVRADSKIGSFSISIRKGVWQDFATGDKGSDPTSLYAYLFCGGDQGKAAKELAERLNISSNLPHSSISPVPQQNSNKPQWHPILPVAADAGDPPAAHIKRGKPERTWCYRGANGEILGYVYRFKTSDGGKEVLPLSWCRNEEGRSEWRWMSFPEPRPLYRLDALAAHPKASVLLVEGEKCADAAAMEIECDELVIVSWPGGGKADGKVDWFPLYGRKVILWPDCDSQREKMSKEEKEAGVDPASKPYLPKDRQPGFSTMLRIGERLSENGCKIWDVQIDEPGLKPDGWDVADAIADGLRADDLREYIRAKSVLRAPALSGEESISTAPEAGAIIPEWRRGLMWKSENVLQDCRENVFLILSRHPAWKGKIGYNEFSGRIEKLEALPIASDLGEWSPQDDLDVGLWLAQNYPKLLIKGEGTLAAGISMVAAKNKFHPVREWLRSLPWDGKSRLRYLFSDCFGTAESEYFALCGQYFLIGMVARIFKPGCAMQYMPILEGSQGKGKSTALRILGGEWYAETPFKIGDKDAYMQIAGVWLYEIPELDSFNRAESTAVKAFVTIQTDRYREPYARRTIDRPRQCVFAGNTNHGEYFKDPTGNRRFWPIRCGQIDLDRLREWREQLFAEACALFDQGEKWYPGRDEEEKYFKPQQEEREIVDPWLYTLYDWLDDPENRAITEITSSDLLKRCFHVSHDKVDGNRGMATRIGNLMHRLGWAKKRRSTGYREWIYCRPAPAVSGGAINVPF